MTTTEQAREFAINALESQIATIADAYEKGYADGVASSAGHTKRFATRV